MFDALEQIHEAQKTSRVQLPGITVVINTPDRSSGARGAIFGLVGVALAAAMDNSDRNKIIRYVEDGSLRYRKTDEDIFSLLDRYGWKLVVN